MPLNRFTIGVYLAAIVFTLLSTDTVQQGFLRDHQNIAIFIRTTSKIAFYVLLPTLLASLLLQIDIIEEVLRHVDPVDIIQSTLSLVVQVLDLWCLAGVVAALCYDRIIIQFGYPPPQRRAFPRSLSRKPQLGSAHNVVPLAKARTPILQSQRTSPFLSPDFFGLAHLSIACLLFLPPLVLDGGTYLLANDRRLFGQTPRVYQVAMTAAVYLAYIAYPFTIRLISLRWQYWTRVFVYFSSGVLVGLLSLVCAYLLIPNIIGADAEAYLRRGTFLASQGKYTEALQDLNEAIRLNTRLSAAYNNRGNIFARKDQYDKALEDYTTAINVDPSLAPAHANRCETYRTLAMPNEAMADAEMAIARDPKLGKAYFCEGLLNYDAGNNQEAIVNFKNASEFDPEVREQADTLIRKITERR